MACLCYSRLLVKGKFVTRMKEIQVGIQGGIGSTNERACRFFAEKHHWQKYDILYLITTERVLEALHRGEIDFGTFAWESSRKGLVEETQEAIKKYDFQKIDEEKFQLDHALLSRESIDTSKTVHIFSHPMALEEHRIFLEKEFPNLKMIDEIDTALAAEKLKKGEYPENSLVIAPLSCAEIYGLGVYISDLPTNAGYITTIYLAKVEKALT